MPILNKIFFSFIIIGSLLLFSCQTPKIGGNASPVVAKLVSNNIVVAHRGAWKTKNLPQNSIAALRYSIDLGCAGTEYDIRITADDSLIINHDPAYFGMDVESTPYLALAEKRLPNGEILPTLRSFLTEGMKNNSTTILVCEIKPSPAGVAKSQYLAEKVVQLVRECGAEPYVAYISFSYEILQKIREIDPNATTQFLNGTKTPSELKQDGMSGLDYHYSVFQKNPDWIAQSKAHKLALNAWTVNKAEDMDWFLERQFDYITTDEPELLLKKISDRSSNRGQ